MPKKGLQTENEQENRNGSENAGGNGGNSGNGANGEFGAPVENIFDKIPNLSNVLGYKVRVPEKYTNRSIAETEIPEELGSVELVQAIVLGAMFKPDRMKKLAVDKAEQNGIRLHDAEQSKRDYVIMNVLTGDANTRGAEYEAALGDARRDALRALRDQDKKALKSYAKNVVDYLSGSGFGLKSGIDTDEKKNALGLFALYDRVKDTEYFKDLRPEPLAETLIQAKLEEGKMLLTAADTLNKTKLEGADVKEVFRAAFLAKGNGLKLQELALRDLPAGEAELWKLMEQRGKEESEQDFQKRQGELAERFMTETMTLADQDAELKADPAFKKSAIAGFMKLKDASEGACGALITDITDYSMVTLQSYMLAAPDRRERFLAALDKKIQETGEYKAAMLNKDPKNVQELVDAGRYPEISEEEAGLTEAEKKEFGELKETYRKNLEGFHDSFETMRSSLFKKMIKKQADDLRNQQDTEEKGERTLAELNEELKESSDSVGPRHLYIGGRIFQLGTGREEMEKGAVAYAVTKGNRIYSVTAEKDSGKLSLKKADCFPFPEQAVPREFGYYAEQNIRIAREMLDSAEKAENADIEYLKLLSRVLDKAARDCKRLSAEEHAGAPANNTFLDLIESMKKLAEQLDEVYGEDRDKNANLTAVKLAVLRQTRQEYEEEIEAVRRAIKPAAKPEKFLEELDKTKKCLSAIDRLVEDNSADFEAQIATLDRKKLEEEFKSGRMAGLFIGTPERYVHYRLLEILLNNVDYERNPDGTCINDDLWVGEYWKNADYFKQNHDQIIMYVQVRSPKPEADEDTVNRVVTSLNSLFRDYTVPEADEKKMLEAVSGMCFYKGLQAETEARMMQEIALLGRTLGNRLENCLRLPVTEDNIDWNQRLVSCLQQNETKPNRQKGFNMILEDIMNLDLTKFSPNNEALPYTDPIGLHRFMKMCGNITKIVEEAGKEGIDIRSSQYDRLRKNLLLAERFAHYWTARTKIMQNPLYHVLNMKKLEGLTSVQLYEKATDARDMKTRHLLTDLAAVREDSFADVRKKSFADMAAEVEKNEAKYFDKEDGTFLELRESLEANVRTNLFGKELAHSELYQAVIDAIDDYRSASYGMKEASRQKVVEACENYLRIRTRHNDRYDLIEKVHETVNSDKIKKIAGDHSRRGEQDVIYRMTAAYESLWKRLKDRQFANPKTAERMSDLVSDCRQQDWFLKALKNQEFFRIYLANPEGMGGRFFADNCREAVENALRSNPQLNGRLATAPVSGRQNRPVEADRVQPPQQEALQTGRNPNGNS